MLLFAILFLFFIHLLTDFIGAIYAFGLLGTSIPPELAYVALLFSPVLLLIARRGLPGWLLQILGYLIVIARVVEPSLDTSGRLLASGIGVAAFLIFFPGLLWALGQQGVQPVQEVSRLPHPIRLVAGLAMALGLSVLWRAWDSGVDLSTDGYFQVIAWALALVAGVLMWKERAIFASVQRQAINPPVSLPAVIPPKFAFLRLAGLCVGVMAVINLLYISLAAPSVISRWTEGNYLAIMILMLLLLAGYGFDMARGGGYSTRPPKVLLLVWNVLFLLALVFTILPNQISFSGDPGAYPYYAPAVSSLARYSLVVMLLLWPVLLVSFQRYIQAIVSMGPSLPRLGGGFTLAAFYLLFMVFAHVFTTVYDYIPVVGLFFRDRFWLVYLLAGLGAALPLFAIPRGDVGVSAKQTNEAKGNKALPGIRRLGWMLLVLGVMAIIGAKRLATYQVAAQPVIEKDQVRILTYNIRQGYNDAGNEDHAGQLELLIQVDADLIGLQESDTDRISGANNDLVRYFADRLNYHSYFGPRTVTGTFGIALLSRYPIHNPRTFYMYSEGEQTATIWAQIELGGETYDIFVTHLGNGGPLIQQEQILQEVDGLEHVILMGDFNFRPDSEQYTLTTSLLNDGWSSIWPGGDDGSGIDPSKRIDHVFTSEAVTVRNALFLDWPQSDHPALFVDIEP